VTENAIAVNLRRLRLARAYSQDRLAAEAGLSRAAYRKVEVGQSQPRVSTVQALARALGVSLEELVTPVPMLTAVRFRSHKRLRSREQVLADVSRWLQGFNEVEALLGDHAPYAVEIADRAHRDQPGAAAARVRSAFGLSPSEPIRDICGLLEAHGVKVYPMQLASPDFFGLSVGPVDGGPAVVVNTWERISVERWIFTAAHELGHLVLHLGDYDVARTDEPEEHEKQANEFAAAFLMPDGPFEVEWNDTYGMPLVERVLKVKRMFRVSYRTVLHRLAPRYRKKKGANIWTLFQVHYKRRYGVTLLRDDEPEALAADAFRASFPESRRASEPEHLSHADFAEDRLGRLVRRAIEKQHISLGRGAEILGLSTREMRELAASWVG
jgi:Zn-dependent peptidase ImmA (M78 family)/transcriptional regulator with XRE-family HTH domain